METGHAKNVANFETSIIVITNLGPVYDPKQPLIKIPALEAKLAEARTALAAAEVARSAMSIAVDEREVEFEDLDKLAVMVKRTAEVEVDDPAFTGDILSIVRKLRGSRAAPKPVDDPATPGLNEAAKTRSVSQRSYDSLISHFSELIELLNAKGSYNPDNSAVQIAALESKLAALEAKNNAAKAAEAALGSARDTRDEILYNEETGILKLVKLIKTQLLINPGRDSSAYQQINALEFRKR